MARSSHSRHPRGRRALAFAALLAASAFCGGCRRTQVEAPQPTTPPPAEIWKEFSGAKALEEAKAQIALGPRPPGTPAHSQAKDQIIARLNQNGWSVHSESFTAQTPRGPVKFVNLIARYGRTEPEAVRTIVGAHYDTKSFDTITFVGANDGASAVGTLLELSRVLALDPALARQVELAFFDGKDAFVQPTDSDGLYGSRHYAEALRAKGRAKQIKAALILNQIGSTDMTLSFPVESTFDLADAIRAAAAQLQSGNYLSTITRPIWDDYLPLHQAQIPSTALVDTRYPYHHTADDTLDKLSAGSLETVGALTLRWLKDATTANAAATPQ